MTPEQVEASRALFALKAFLEISRSKKNTQLCAEAMELLQKILEK